MSAAPNKPRAAATRRSKARPKPGTSTAAAEARRKHFVEAYVGNGGNGTMAAKAVGFSARSAHTTAHRLLKDVDIVSAVRQRRSALQAKYELTAEDAIQKLAQMVYFDPAVLYDEQNELKPISLWPPGAASCVQIESSPGGPMKVKALTSHDPLIAALKHLGMFEKDNRQRAYDPIRDLMEQIAKHNKGIPVKP